MQKRWIVGVRTNLISLSLGVCRQLIALQGLSPCLSALPTSSFSNLPLNHFHKVHLFTSSSRLLCWVWFPNLVSRALLYDRLKFTGCVYCWLYFQLIVLSWLVRTHTPPSYLSCPTQRPCHCPCLVTEWAIAGPLESVSNASVSKKRTGCYHENQ